VIAGVLATAALLVAPPLAVLVIAGTAVRARHVAARTRHRAERAVTTVLPDVVDLLALATSAGVALPIAHPLVAARVPGPVGEALHAAAAAAAAGDARADALVRALTPLGDGARRLADVLADHLRYGLPLGPGLDRLGAELRLHRRRRAEQDARRVPVRLLGPLVACVLPAFALLTVVPLLAASLRALPA
jgi:tight adherence protein C